MEEDEFRGKGAVEAGGGDEEEVGEGVTKVVEEVLLEMESETDAVEGRGVEGEIGVEDGSGDRGGGDGVRVGGEEGENKGALGEGRGDGLEGGGARGAKEGAGCSFFCA